jgi:hypothetical protein
MIVLEIYAKMGAHALTVSTHIVASVRLVSLVTTVNTMLTNVLYDPPFVKMVEHVRTHMAVSLVFASTDGRVPIVVSTSTIA